MFRVAVSGLGHPHILDMIKEFLAEELDFLVIAICDPDSPELLQKAHEIIPNAKVYASEDELYQNGIFDIVLSSAINKNKGEIAIRALRAGKSIMFDKPLVTNINDLLEIERLINNNPKLQAVLWLTCRYSKNYYTAKKLIEAGEIGDVVHIYLERPHRLAPAMRPAWMFDSELYGGIINDIGIHDLDIARWYTNSECEKILSATVSNKRFCNFNIEDNGSVYMKMKSGADVMIFENWLTPDKFPVHGDTRAYVTGTKGVIEVLTYPEDTVKLVTDTQAPKNIPIFAPEFNSVQDFAKVLKKPAHHSIVSTNDSLLATKLALTAQQLAQN